MLESAALVKAGFERVFAGMRRRLEDPNLDLAWRPDPTWNSYAVLIRHVCGYAQQMVADRVAGLPVTPLTREEQFAPEPADRQSLTRLVDETQALLGRALEGLSASVWHDVMDLYGTPRTKGEVVLFNLLHASQHMGQMDLMDRVRRSMAGAV